MSKLQKKNNRTSDSVRPVPDCEGALRHYEAGRALWQQGDRAGAITEFNSSVSLDPASPAVAALDMINGIMDYYNKDLYNP